MAQQYRFRKGCENENLAQYILSRFFFVARPVSVSDDVGTDFSCTLFQKVEDGSLIPRTSFAIQIKSHKRIASKKNRIDITRKIDYLRELEVPFFFGIVNKDENSLPIYSGELIPRFFSLKGRFIGLYQGETQVGKLAFLTGTQGVKLYGGWAMASLEFLKR